MKGVCTGFDGEEYQLRFEGDHPEVGSSYNLEDAVTGTEAQRGARESLIREYWKSGVHPKYGGDGYTTFRDKLKRDLGEGFEKYIYATIESGKPKIKTVDDKEKIPREIMEDDDMRDMVQGKLKSCTHYGKKANKRFIDNIIDDATANGCNTNHWQEIIKGMTK